MKNSFLILTLLATTSLASNAWADSCPSGTSCPNKFTCECNSAGQVTEANFSGMEYGTYVTRKYIYEYDTATGLKTSYSTYFGEENIANNRPSTRELYTYDANGNITSSTNYSGADNVANNIPSDQFRYTYDESNHKITSTQYSGEANIANSVPHSQTRWTYDANGNKTSETVYSGTNNVEDNIPSYQFRLAYKEDGSRRYDLYYKNAEQIENNTPDTETYYYGSGSSNRETWYCQGRDKGYCHEDLVIDCTFGYITGCTGYTQGAETYNYANPIIVCATGAVAGCTNPSSAINNQEGTGDNTAGGSENGSSNTGQNTPKRRIYTVEEARQAVEAAGTDTVNFRIRYK